MREHAITQLLGGTPADKARKDQDLQKEFTGEAYEGSIGRLEFTPNQRGILRLVDDETNYVAKRYGGESLSLAEDQVYLVKEGHPEVMEGLEENGFFDTYTQKILLDSQFSSRSPLFFGHMLFHEMMHAKMHNSLVKHRRASMFLAHRSGLRLDRYSRDFPSKETKVFDHLNEGVTEELSLRFMAQNHDHPLFRESSEDRMRMEASRLAAISTANEPDFSFDSMMKNYHYPLLEPTNKHKIRLDSARKEECAIVKRLTRLLWERNKATFENRGTVFDLFAESAFTGNLLATLRLIQTSLGNEAYDVLAAPEEDDDHNHRVLNYLERYPNVQI